MIDSSVAAIVRTTQKDGRIQWVLQENTRQESGLPPHIEMVFVAQPPYFGAPITLDIRVAVAFSGTCPIEPLKEIRSERWCVRNIFQEYTEIGVDGDRENFAALGESFDDLPRLDGLLMRSTVSITIYPK
jgi:hypothetical protein